MLYSGLVRWVTRAFAEIVYVFKHSWLFVDNIPRFAWCQISFVPQSAQLVVGSDTLVEGPLVAIMEGFPVSLCRWGQRELGIR